MFQLNQKPFEIIASGSQPHVDVVAEHTRQKIPAQSDSYFIIRAEPVTPQIW